MAFRFFITCVYCKPSNSPAQEPAAQTHASFLRQNSPVPDGDVKGILITDDGAENKGELKN